MDFEDRIWRCRQCSLEVDTVRNFALHLRTHLSGHRTRSKRKPEKSVAQDKSKKKLPFHNSASILKFDNISTSQLEISQPNSLFNLMNVNFETREMCKQLVDPSLVMPSKRNVEENNEFNYTELLNLNQPSGTDNENIENNTMTNNKLQILTKDLNLESPTKECILNTNFELNNVEVNSNKECATITPLNLFYIDGKNYTSSAGTDVETVQTNVNQISIPDSCDFIEDGNVVLVDNSVDETVRLMNFGEQIVSGAPIQIVALNTPSMDEEFTCEICRKKFLKATYLFRHLQLHIGDFTCKYCDKEFARKETWMTHSCLLMKEAEANRLQENSSIVEGGTITEEIPVPSNPSGMIHPGLSEQAEVPNKKIYRCEICDVTIKDKSGLNKHMFTHSEVCYTCVYCDTTVKHRHSVRRHLQRRHREYEHEWSNPDFISILQTDVKSKRNKSKASNSKKKKRGKKNKSQQQEPTKIPTISAKKDSLIGTLSDELKLRFETNSLNRTKGSQISDYLNCETSVNSVRDDSSDLLSFTKHFDDDIAHMSFQALTLPDVTSKSFTGSEILKIDSKDGLPLKNFNISPMMLFNKNSKKSNECLTDISPEKSSSMDIDKIQKFFSTPIKDKCVFFESPVKNWSEGKVMPSMPVLFCEEEPVEATENNGVEILVCQPLPESSITPVKSPQELLSSLSHPEDPTPSCSAGYILEDSSAKSSMQLMDTSTDFTFFVLS